MLRKLKAGDIVSVSVHGSQMTLIERAKIINVPEQTGESWIFETAFIGSNMPGKLVYVSEGCTVEEL